MPYRLTPLGVAVLALLRDRPMHGYQMFQTLVDRQADRIVKVRPGSLYHVVDRLAEEKLIRGRRRAGTEIGRSGRSMKSPTPVLRRSPIGYANWWPPQPTSSRSSSPRLPKYTISMPIPRRTR
ncbi:PadR family transcriptional regulator [uncultured Mycobacterium sp.]|uniref:PadR family transcriptional regulator n=1 Tax=uncultured Mycobacterium sp. TaxID=171292 RepID=UPI0035CA3610